MLKNAFLAQKSAISMITLRKIQILKKPKKHDVFGEDFDSSTYRSILFDCLKNLESKVKEIFVNQIA